MDDINVHSNAGYVGAAVAALVGIAWGLRQFFVRWKQDGVHLAAAEASTAEQKARKTIVEQLHDELARMSQENLALAVELNKLQLHIVELTRQIALLTAENLALKNEIEDLRREITRLRNVGQS